MLRASFGIKAFVSGSMTEGINTRLQKEVNQLQAEVERVNKTMDMRFDEMRAEFRKLLDRISAHEGSPTIDKQGSQSLRGQESSPAGSSTMVTTHYPNFYRSFKLECPKFNGDDFKGWLMKVEPYFEGEGVPKGSKVRVAMLSLEEKA
ncbi:uncharacterized protein LOC111288325 [Durio zibethinus]|uniref:Uncharacterized protein LOC111288325 n=1 Tax=Durio zibethinus TaxID=66656 RepID=A0A6P5Y389_DURZI|nr:uncharacterized protein LOC111288325 [Durio zibethinus]